MIHKEFSLLEKQADLMEFKINRVLIYCEKHLDLMWAATIVGELLECDFKDSKEQLKKYWRSKKGETK
jgi:hypothetical protein